MDPVSARTPRFRRTYVACDSCRSRKVRCAVGDKPPCAKCRREHRECRFDRRPTASKHRDRPTWAKPSPSQPPHSGPASVASGSPDGVITQPSQERVHPPEAAPSNLPGGRGSEWLRGCPYGPPSLSDRVVTSLVKGSNDALDILSEVAGVLHNAAISPPVDPLPNQPSDSGPVAVPANERPDCHGGVGFHILTLSEPTDATLDMWDKCRFVRQGWFTSQEAVTYVDLFFKYLSPLSAVAIDQFRDHEAHAGLIYDEAMLCCAILMISSRFFLLPGPGGESRSHIIHNRLWQCCELMVKRIMLGQEKLSSAKMRSIGTIEGLMLISDWHPRAIHFPPDTEGWDALLVDTVYERDNRKRTNGQEPLVRWRNDVFEPAKRASRMSWMLLGLATNLAYELGVLSNGQHPDPSAADAGDLRRARAQRLLYSYMTQTALRLGYQSVFPESVAAAASRPSPGDGRDASHNAWNAYIDANLDLIRLSKLSSSMFFQSVAHLQGLLLNDNYPDVIDHFLSLLSKWKVDFDAIRSGVAEPLRDSLLIEFYNLRACISAISMQAVVHRATGASSGDGTKDGLSSYLTGHDTRLLRHVVSDSSRVLHIAASNAFRTHLAYAPARIRISVIASSVFLLKAIAIGAPSTEVPALLHTLDCCTATFKKFAPDDMDFALRYAQLVQEHTSYLRRTLAPALAGPWAGGVGQDQNSPGYWSDLAASLSGLPNERAGDVDMGLDLNGTCSLLPLDLSMAPFGESADQLSRGFEVDSLNFLWNLPEVSL